MSNGDKTNNVNVTNNIIKLLNLKRSMYQEIYSAEKQISRFKKSIDQIENILMDLCEHQWEYEYCSGPYDKPDKICKLCDSRIIRL